MPAWRGFYKDRYPCITVQLAGTRGHPEDVIATVDTGFSGFLLLPASAIGTHGLEVVGTTMATLADGSSLAMKTAMASVGFANCTRTGVATIVARESTVLIGLDFLRKFELALVLTHTGLCLPPVADVAMFMR